MHDSILAQHLVGHWSLRGIELNGLAGGMNSATWLVTSGSRRWVAKLVPRSEGEAFHTGLTAAALVENTGLRTGVAVPTRTGALAAAVPDGWLALLTWVPGEPLAGHSARDQRMMGQTLAIAHGPLAGESRSGATSFPWIDPEAEHLGILDWIRPAVLEALRGWQEVRDGKLTWGLIHGDPAPDAFRDVPNELGIGLIDWGAATHGPLMYDVASAVMYTGGIRNSGVLRQSYLERGVLSAHEAHAGLHE